MDAPVLGVPLLLVAFWLTTGMGLLIAFHRSGSPIVLRLAATFLALWAVLVTTVVAWVVVQGGWDGVVDLSRSPFTLFQPQFASVWLVGAVGAFVVFAVAFLVNQLVGRGWLNVLRPTLIDWPDRLPPREETVTLLGFPDLRVAACSFTLLEWGGPRLLRRREVILLSAGLRSALAPEELDAVIAHELGHVRDLDGRYLTFFRTFARLMRWDPMLGRLASALTWREEYRADDEAVAITHNPRALARALFKASTHGTTDLGMGTTAFAGTGGRRGRAEAWRRIRRLVALAESEAREGRGGA
jgi:Zn-dependent protease with chaperone function